MRVCTDMCVMCVSGNHLEYQVYIYVDIYTNVYVYTYKHTHRESIFLPFFKN